jgi:hypothetical protein
MSDDTAKLVRRKASVEDDGKIMKPEFGFFVA